MTGSKKFRPVPTEGYEALLDRVLALTEEGRIVFIGTESEHNWNAVEGDCKFHLSRAKDGRTCLAVYTPGAKAVFIRSSGGRIGDKLTELYAQAKWRQATIDAAAALKSINESFPELQEE